MSYKKTEGDEVTRPCRFEKEVSTIPKEDMIPVDGTVVECMGNTTFKAKIAEGHEVLAQLPGKMRKRYIKVIAGDRVTVELSPYSLTKGRVAFRHQS